MSTAPDNLKDMVAQLVEQLDEFHAEAYSASVDKNVLTVTPSIRSQEIVLRKARERVELFAENPEMLVTDRGRWDNCHDFEIHIWRYQGIQRSSLPTELGRF